MENSEEQLNTTETSPQDPKTGYDPKTWAIVVLIAALAVLGFAYISDKDSSSETPPVSTDDQSNDTIDGTEGWETYRNEEYGFEIKFPNDAEVIPNQSFSNIWAIWYLELIEDFKVNPSRYHGDFPGNIYIQTREAGHIESSISATGSQFDDRSEQRQALQGNEVTGLRVIVTTKTIKDWVSDTVYFEQGERSFSLTNGGSGKYNRDLFEQVVSTFKFID